MQLFAQQTGQSTFSLRQLIAFAESLPESIFQKLGADVPAPAPVPPTPKETNPKTRRRGSFTTLAPRRLAVNDHEIVLAIQEELDGSEWTSATLDRIATLLIDNGYRVRDLADADREAAR